MYDWTKPVPPYHRLAAISTCMIEPKPVPPYHRLAAISTCMIGLNLSLPIID